MAAFSYQHHPFLLDSIFLLNTPIKISGSGHEGNINATNTAFCSQFYTSSIQPVQEIPVDVGINESRCLENSSPKPINSGNELSVTKKLSTESSLVVDKLESGEQVTQKVMTSMDKKRKNREGSCLSSVQSKHAREGKNRKQRKFNGSLNDVEEKKTRADKKDEKKVPEETPKGYIHVRARRGQATDSHSLAERVRREKISERMKLLQALVPGCDKVTGKALMLDEIINYVQSLQNQVEFLSMKLASVNPMLYDFGVDLDAFIVRPESLSQECSPTQVTTFADATTTTTSFTTPTNNYFHDDSLFLQQGQRQNLFSQDNGSLLWDADDQRQKLINQAGLISNNVCSFN